MDELTIYPLTEAKQKTIDPCQIEPAIDQADQLDIELKKDLANKLLQLDNQILQIITNIIRR